LVDQVNEMYEGVLELLQKAYSPNLTQNEKSDSVLDAISKMKDL